MSAFGGKADIHSTSRDVRLLTQSGHEPSSRSPLPVCLSGAVRCAILSLGARNEAARVRQFIRQCGSMAVRGVRAAAADAGCWVLGN